MLALFTGATLIAGAARADDQPDSAPAQPVHFGLVYDADEMGVASGGVGRGADYVDRLVVSGDADLDKVFGWRGLSAHVDLETNLSATPSGHAGSMLGLDGNEMEEGGVRLGQAWLQQSFDKDRGSLLVGFYDIGADFNTLPSSALLIGAGSGLSPELAASGPDGPSDFPETSPTVRLRYQPTPDTYAQAMVANAQAGVLGDRDGPNFTFRDGVFMAAEGGYGGHGKLAVGAWGYSNGQPDIREANALGVPALHRAWGAYLLAEYPLWEPKDGVRKLTAFFRAGVSDGATTPWAGSWTAGFLVEKVFASRPDSAFNAAVTQGVFDRRFRANQADDGMPTGPTETVVEATYIDSGAPHLKLQPDLQWVHRPSGQAGIDDALAAGLRAIVEF